MNHPLFAVTANDAGDAGIGSRCAFPQDSSQVVAPLGFDDCIHILSGNKSGTQGQGDRSHVPIGSQVLLGKNGIYYRQGLQPGDTFAHRVYQDAQFPFVDELFRLFYGLHQVAGHILHRLSPLVHRLAKGHIPADSGRVWNLQDQHRETTFFQFVNRAGGQIAATPDDN